MIREKEKNVIKFDIPNTHPVSVEKMITHFKKTGNWKSFPEPSLSEKIIFNLKRILYI
jgi:hypothetical protein